MRIYARYTPETIQVYPLDMKRLNQDIDQAFHKDGSHPANITYHAHGNWALMRRPKLCIIDDEFVGHVLTEEWLSRHGPASYKPLYVYEEEHRPDSGFTGHWHPSHEVSMTNTELEAYLKPSTSLAEFSKERRGHNSRIRANEAEWIEYLNSNLPTHIEALGNKSKGEDKDNGKM